MNHKSLTKKNKVTCRLQKLNFYEESKEVYLGWSHTKWKQELSKVSVLDKIRDDNLIENIKWVEEDKYPKVTFHHHSTGRTKVDHKKEGNKAATGRKKQSP